MCAKGRATLIYWRDLAYPISKKTQRPLGGNGGVELTDRTGCGVARVNKGFFALVPCGNAHALARVQSLKIVAAHIDLATDFQHRWNPCWQAQWNLPDGADVLGHVFARLAIAAGGCLHQHTVLVAQTHGQAVELQFGDVFHRRIGLQQLQLLAHPDIKRHGARRFGICFGAYAEHGHRVAHGCKLIQRLAPHALCRRIRCHPFRVGCFQRLQFLKEAVIFCIRHLRGVQHVVLVRMLVQLLAQCI